MAGPGSPVPGPIRWPVPNPVRGRGSGVSRLGWAMLNEVFSCPGEPSVMDPISCVHE